MASIQPSECSIFIQIWVDTNALQNGSLRGVYLVDSNHNNGSVHEGMPDLETDANTNDKICWQVLSTNIHETGTLTIQNMGNASVWGAGGTPQQVTGNTWTGQVMNNGVANYNINIALEPEGGTGISTTANPQLRVS